MRLFVNTIQAATMLGCGLKAFRNRYVQSGRIPVHVFKAANRVGTARYMVVDIEKVRREDVGKYTNTNAKS